MKSKPAHEIKVGGVKATIWPNESHGKTRHTVTASRSFKANGEWHQTSSFHKSDLPKLIEALSQAEQWMTANEPSLSE